METLKQATHDAHIALERDGRIASLFDSDAGLTRLLGRWYGFLVPFEAELRNHLGSMRSMLLNRSRIDGVSKDLADRGLRAGDFPLCPELPSLNGLDSALGAMYVTEGSTLGGSILAKKIEQTLGLRDGRGYSFFLGYGSENGAMWREFSNLVNATVSTDPGNATTAARETFRCLHGWLAA